jgi:hypothetical protein
MARQLSAKRLFHKRFKMAYGPIIANEHVNTIFEIEPLLVPRFKVERKKFFPLPMPVIAPNLIIAMRLRKS